ncbi:MAG: class I SAM-dependent methyltransferase [Bacteroidetes bacterium]|nr:class I SAM-dependent methyltransferase [Bacteroidota bacterium]
MKEAKDLFSKQAGTYAAYRPTYPEELYDFLFQHTSAFHAAWDCGTGNGQNAIRIAERFHKVYATDLSEQQILHAIQKPNIEYSVQRSEHTHFADNSFDMITVATALHWFDFDAFFKEAKRVAKNGALFAAWAYAPFRSDSGINHIVDDFTYNTMGKYWDPERRWVDEEYKTIPMAFEELPHPDITITVQWTFEHILGYFHSWSSVQNYIRQHNEDPVEIIKPLLAHYWQEGEAKALKIPLFIRAGTVWK